MSDERWPSLDRGGLGGRIAAGLAAVYVVWGSTYLAIRFAIETLPPFLMSGTRFVIAGTALYGWARWRGAPRPERASWPWALAVGGLLLLGGNGGVVWAETRVPSGLAALLVATVPLWMVLLEGLRPGGTRPGGRILAGVALGLCGVALLIGPGELIGGQRVDPVGALVLILASLSWAVGSLVSRAARLPRSPLLATGMEMLAGGALLILAGLATGELRDLDLAGASTRSWLAMGYLVVFGSLVGFTAYIWLLRVITPAVVSTYAFVNPVVAVFLGWALASEPVTGRTLLAAAVIVSGVVVITTARLGGRVTPSAPLDARPTPALAAARAPLAPSAADAAATTPVPLPPPVETTSTAVPAECANGRADG